MPYPAKITPTVIEEVLSRIAQGETLASLGRELGFHPQSWANRMRADEELALAYAHARDVGADALAEQTLDLIDAEPARVEGRVDAGHVAWQRARVDTRLKLLACWNPKKYGNKQVVDVGNKEGEALKVDSNVDTTALTMQLAAALRAAPDADK